MSPAKILEHVRRQPFRAFRVHVSDGSSCDVAHPEMIAVSRADVAIALEDDNGDVPARLMFCDPLHITRIEPLTDTNRKKSARKRRK
jgi:hypothetical protein